MHPRQCDSINRMANLPQFYEWVADRRNPASEPVPAIASDGTTSAAGAIVGIGGNPRGAASLTEGVRSRVTQVAPDTPSWEGKEGETKVEVDSGFGAGTALARLKVAGEQVSRESSLGRQKKEEGSREEKGEGHKQ